MRRAPALLLAVGLLLAGCGGDVEPVAVQPRPSPEVLLPSGAGPLPVVVLVPGGGWSSADPSGLVPLAVLAALRPTALGGDCDAPAVRPAAVAGLAGAYDLRALSDIAIDLMGDPPDVAPSAWHEADVYAWAAERPELPVLLLHGDADELVPLSMSDRLADALAAGGHRVTREVVPGADHHDVFQADVAAPLLLPWIGGLRA